MTQRTTGARHRAASRPSTPLTAFGQVVTDSGNGRRALAIVASSGLALTMGASTAASVPASNTNAGLGSLSNLSLDDDSISTSPTVTVDADADWSFTSAVVSSNAPLELATTTIERSAVPDAVASRTGQRVQPEPQPEPAPQPQTQSAPSASNDDSNSDSGEQESSGSSEEANEQPAAAPASGSGSAAVSIGRQYIGVPYVWGGGTPAGFDCSGFTSYVYAQLGVSLPRSSGAQRNAGRQVSASEARPGDMVWWPGHIGIYSGNGNHIAARNPSKPLTEGPISHVGRGAPVYIRVIE